MFSLRFLQAFVCAVCLAAPLAAQTGTIAGQVTDSTGGALPGAQVSVEGSPLTAVTDVAGSYRLVRVPAGPQILTVSYFGFQPQTVPVEVPAGESLRQDVRVDLVPVEGETLTVTAEPILEGQARALNQQKNAINIKNVVAADQIGQFPDLNAAEATQRIPGVSIQRDQGEGRYVLIRGTEARLNSTTLNGERIPAPEGDVRNVALDVIPSDLLEAIEVSKALTPDMDGDAIGGTVNLITKIAPDTPRLGLDLGLGYNDLMEDTGYKAGFVYGRRSGGRLGLLLAGSALETDRGSDNFEAEYDDGDLDTLETRDYTITRERYGATAALDYAPSARSSWFARGIWNRFDDQEYRRATIYGVGDGEIDRELKDRFESQEILSLSAGGQSTVGQDLLLEYRVAYGSAGEREPDAYYTTFRQEDVEFDPNVEPDAIDPDNIQANPQNEDVNEYVLDGIAVDDNDTSEEDLVGALDLSLPLTSERLLGGFLKTGLKVRSRTKERDNRTTVFEVEDDLLLADFIDSGFAPGDFLDGRYRLGPHVDPGLARGILSRFDVESEDDPEAEMADYEADEQTLAGYLMAELPLGERLKLVPGVRYESTDIEYEGKRVTFDEEGDLRGIEPVTGDNSYGELLPMAHLVWRLGAASNLRAAVTRTLARPNYFDLAPYELVLEEDREIERGNPLLDVTTAWNYDLMAERYFGTLGLVSAGIFYKSLSDYIYVFRSEEEIGGDTFEVTQPRNGESATLWGVELAFQTQFRALPAPWDGLGLYMNYTWTDSEAEFPDREGEKATLPGQSGSLGNMALSYEKRGFSGRLSLNYHGKYIDAVGGSPEEDVYYDDHYQLDFSASQRLTDRLRLTLELINLTDEPLRYYEGSSDRPIQEEHYSWWGTLGLKWSLF